MQIKTIRRFAILAIAAGMFSALCLVSVLAQQPKVGFNQQPQSVIEARFKHLGAKDAEREKILMESFTEAGCNNLIEQPVKHEKIPNVICTLPGATDTEIIVGAHTDHVDAGSGAIDNWSGAALLPSFLQALNIAPRKHTFVFIGFTQEEAGLIGSQFYVKQLTPEQIAKIRVMINLDCVGLGPTKVWLGHSDKNFANTLHAVATAMGLSLTAVEGPEGEADEDSTPFRKRGIPAVMVHSLTQPTLSYLHTDKDQPSALKMQDYYDSYRLISAYLAYLDAN